MTEQINLGTPELGQQPTREELLELGRACLDVVADEYQLASHRELQPNPNTVGGFAISFSSGEIPTEPGKVYRQVGFEAVEDLARSGIVRNGATANGEGHARWGHRVFWSEGQEGVYTNTGGRAVIVVPKQATEGWVTADRLEAIYVKTPDGDVINILSQPAGRT